MSVWWLQVNIIFYFNFKFYLYIIKKSDVNDYEKLNRVGEGTYGVVYRYIFISFYRL